MAKLSGFFMSTLLIVLCLWINVCHYPDAARTPASESVNEAVPIDETRFPADAEPSVPQQAAPEKSEDANPNDAEPSDDVGIFADADVDAALLDASASRPLDSASAKPTLPALEPASFPVDGAEIDDENAAGFDATPENDASVSLQAPAPFPTPNAVSAPDSNDATPPKDGRRSTATKTRGAKYVRVPDVEIDAFSGGVRALDAPYDETRVVGATRAGATLRVSAPVR